MATHELPAKGEMVKRGLTKRCAVCGTGHLFRRWVKMAPVCPGCGIRFIREPGHWTGDLGLNTIVTFGTLLIVLLSVTLLTWPTLALGPIVAGFAIAAIVPVLFYPFSKTIWLAIDLSINPLRPGELPERLAEAAAST